MVTAAVKMKGACSLEGEPGPACGAAGGSDVRLSAAPWVAAHGLLCPWDSPGQEYWSGFPCHPPGDLPHSGIKPTSPESPAL